MTKYKVDIEASDVIVTGANTAGINNSDLATYLVRDAGQATADMSEKFGKMSVDDIKISADGSVMIDTEEFRKLAKDTVNNPVTPVAGWGCVNGSCAAL